MCEVNCVCGSRNTSCKNSKRSALHGNKLSIPATFLLTSSHCFFLNLGICNTHSRRKGNALKSLYRKPQIKVAPGRNIHKWEKINVTQTEFVGFKIGAIESKLPCDCVKCRVFLAMFRKRKGTRGEIGDSKAIIPIFRRLLSVALVQLKAIGF